MLNQLFPTLCNPMDCSPQASSVHGNSPGKNTEVGCHTLLRGIFPSQGSNPGLPHCRWIFYHLSPQGSPRKLEWEADPFSRGTSWPRIKPGSPALLADSLPAELSGKPSHRSQAQMKKNEDIIINGILLRTMRKFWSILQRWGTRNVSLLFYRKLNQGPYQ